MLAEHMVECHGLGLEPNFCNEYSVAEVVSGISNLAVAKEFRADDGEGKPKFVLTKPEVRIPWMGHPIFEFDNEPMSLEVTLDEDGQDINNYREEPQGQLSTENPARDLRRRLLPGDEAERRPLIPAAMTSKLWWTKMADPINAREGRNRTSTEPAEEPEPEAEVFSHMSSWRNLVRAWEMRNHKKLQEKTWHEVTFVDPHPADMTDLTQGATMTPIVMMEGQWDTWSYGDLMVPEQLMSMLASDNECHEYMSEEKRERKWRNVIKPLLRSLGFKMVSKDGSEWNPPNGMIYYQEFFVKLDSLQKTYRVPDPSVFVNHEVIHYIAHLKDCEQAIKQWEEHATIGNHYIDGTSQCVPGRLEQYHQPPKHSVSDTSSGVERALVRCQTFQLHGAIEVIGDWTDHVSYMEFNIERFNIWNRPRKTNDNYQPNVIEMASTYVGRTPFTFVKPASPTRKNDELSNSQDSGAKRRKVEDLVSLLE
eukprot:4204685-Amphidinium_carterae.1